MKIPLTKPVFDSQELERLKTCLDSGWVTQGPMVHEFEKRFSDLQQVKYSYAVNSCTSALHLAAMSIGLGPGDEALVPAFTWVTSANCIEYTGAKAVFVDIDLNTYNISPEKIEAAITSKTKAIIVVHLFGLSVEMDKILAIAQKHKLFVIEDAACAIGCSYNGVPVGGIGDIGCFSFHPRKVITTGEGGMTTTNNPDFAEKINSLRNHGSIATVSRPSPYIMSEIPCLGYNFRMSDINGAIGVAQLDKLEVLLKERRQCAEYYNEKLCDIEDIAIPFVPPRSFHTYQSYVIRILSGGVARRNKIMDRLAESEIWTRPGTHAVHCLEYYRHKYGLQPLTYPNSKCAEDTSITLPIFFGMSKDNFSFIIKALKNALNN